MKNLFFIIFAFSFILSTTIFAQDSTKSKIKPNLKHGKFFVDKNGDGYNDNAPDSDGDGIPNGRDPDYIPPRDSSGSKSMNNGTGKQRVESSGKRGVCNGTGPRGNRGVCNGTGPRGNRGACDGTGPKGNRRNRKK